MTGMPLAIACLIGASSTLKSAIVVMIPVGLEADACSMMRAMSATSPFGGFRYSTFTPRSCSAFLSAFLIVFHHESESGAWLTKTNRSPSACAAPTPTASGRASAAATRLLRIKLRTIERSSRFEREAREADFATFIPRRGMKNPIWIIIGIFIPDEPRCQEKNDPPSSRRSPRTPCGAPFRKRFPAGRARRRIWRRTMGGGRRQ